jgi:hypothetical protein
LRDAVRRETFSVALLLWRLCRMQGVSVKETCGPPAALMAAKLPAAYFEIASSLARCASRVTLFR